MKSALQEKLMTDIFTITTTATIQEEFPELYVHLSETPLFHTYTDEGISRNGFENYLDSLKTQWATFEKGITTPSGLDFQLNN
jgi:hypothetical protein